MDTASIDWPATFAEAHPEPGASEENLAVALADLRRPLSRRETAEIARSQSNPFPPTDPLHAVWRPFDPRPWRLPDRPLPTSYLSFFRWSDGGTLVNGQ